MKYGDREGERKGGVGNPWETYSHPHIPYGHRACNAYSMDKVDGEANTRPLRYHFDLRVVNVR